MKKKLFLVLVLSIVFVLSFAIVASATTTDTKVTLSDGTEVNLFDSEGNALIWYLDANSTLKFIRADNAVYTSAAKVNNTTEFATYTSEGTEVVYGFCDGNTMERVKIVDNGTEIPATQIVVFNIMDDDITDGGLFDTNGTFNTIYEIHNALNGNGGTNLEYAYLGTNIEYIIDNSFLNCSKLKYVNLEDLTDLVSIGRNGKESRVFKDCKVLFEGQTLDLSNHTKLVNIYGTSNFVGTGFNQIKLPPNIANIGNLTFNNSSLESIAWPQTITHIGDQVLSWCKSLTTVTLPSEIVSMRYDAFMESKSLSTIYYCGTRDQFITFLGNIKINDWENSGNIYACIETYYKDAFWPVVGATTQDEAKALHESLNAIKGNAEAEDIGNLISYAEYKKLTDEQKSGNKYVVYNYSYCEAYNEGVHTDAGEKKDCTGFTCDICKEAVTGEFNAHSFVTKIVFENGFTQTGARVTVCSNREDCTISNTSEDVKALFGAKGYSLSPDKMAINGGYSINLDILEQYESTNKTDIRYGIVIANAEAFGGKDFFVNGVVNSAKALQVEINDEYSHFDCSINFGTTTNDTLKLIVTAYVIEGDNVTFIQADSGEAVDSTLVSGGTFKSVTLSYVVALQPAETKEELY